MSNHIPISTNPELEDLVRRVVREELREFFKEFYQMPPVDKKSCALPWDESEECESCS